jgi:hypothetical protein
MQSEVDWECEVDSKRLAMVVDVSVSRFSARNFGLLGNRRTGAADLQPS